MGSRIMHYSIATIINNELNLDQNFLIGSISPDINKNSKTPKELTHFMTKNSDGEHDIHLDKFIKKYNSHLNSFQLGYYLHLISDDIWLKTIYKENILENKKYTKDAALQLLYSDFHKLNSMLINNYGLKELSLNATIRTGISEVIDADIPEIVFDLNSDFKDSNTTNKLDLLKYDDIVKYINTCISFFKNDSVVHKYFKISNKKTAIK